MVICYIGVLVLSWLLASLAFRLISMRFTPASCQSELGLNLRLQFSFYLLTSPVNDKNTNFADLSTGRCLFWRRGFGPAKSSGRHNIPNCYSTHFVQDAERGSWTRIIAGCVVRQSLNYWRIIRPSTIILFTVSGSDTIP